MIFKHLQLLLSSILFYYLFQLKTTESDIFYFTGRIDYPFSKGYIFFPSKLKKFLFLCPTIH